MNLQKSYENPILRGFHPDPSILRRGDDYYMVNSTFQYFPAILISHSRDLVHWETIGHAVTESRYLDLSELQDSHGIWAPDISFYKGMYYILATLRLNDPPQGKNAPRRVQLMTRSEKPEGPYSEPVRLNVDSIDPSLFTDDDGTCYLVISPGVCVAKLDLDDMKLLERPVSVWAGTGRKSPEGPHIFKRSGYYYAMLAEGGTEYGHCVTAARSKNLRGPYEPCPYNPIFTQSNPNAKLQRCGHGDLVETQNGSWWMVYLCGRPNGGNYTTLGRETALDPVQWNKDGWFTVNHGCGPSEKQVAPDLPEAVYPKSRFDDFNSTRLSPEWEFVRNPDENFCSLEQKPGCFRILTSAGSLDELHAVNSLLRREESFCFTAALKTKFQPRQGEKAGLVCYYGHLNHIEMFLTGAVGRNEVVLEENRNGRKTCLGRMEYDGTDVVLRVRVRKQERLFDLSADGRNWTTVGSEPDCTFLSDEGVTQGKHHTGTLVGMFAVNGGSGNILPADFDWFDYENEAEK